MKKVSSDSDFWATRKSPTYGVSRVGHRWGQRRRKRCGGGERKGLTEEEEEDESDEEEDDCNNEEEEGDSDEEEDDSVDQAHLKLLNPKVLTLKV